MPLCGAVVQAAAFTFLNPHVYLHTVFLMGSIGARQPPESRLWFVARLLAPLFSRPRSWQILDLLIAATMLAIAARLVRRIVGG